MRDHLAALRFAERATNPLREEFALRVMEIRSRAMAGRPRFDAVAYGRMRGPLDTLFDEFYGAFPGDRRAWFLVPLVQSVLNGQRMPWIRASQRIRRAVMTFDRTLWNRIRAVIAP